MTEDMRERFEKAFMESRLKEMAESIRKGVSARTSGTVDALEKLLIAGIRLAIIRWELKDDEGEDLTDEMAAEIAQDTAWACQGEGTCADEPIKEWSEVVTLLRGDSLSGKGQAVEQDRGEAQTGVGLVHGGRQKREDSGTTGNQTTTHPLDHSVAAASAPDRAEELAREIADLVAAKIHFNHHLLTDDAFWEKHIAPAVASLLRDEMGRWIPVSERIPEFEQPVWGLLPFENGNGFALAIVMRSDGEDGWLWHICKEWDGNGMIDWPEMDITNFECDDDYPVKFWMPLSALAAPPREGG